MTASSDKKDGAENSNPDWAEIYSDLLCHTSIRFFEIRKMTIPQINAVRNKLGKNIALKVGMPGGIFGGAIEEAAPSPSGNTGKPPKLSEFMAFANAFND